MIRLAIPSKGRLMDGAADWFAARGVALTRTGAAREYAAEVEGVGGVALQLLSATEIPGALAAGRVHLGVTGSDLVREGHADWAARVEALAPLGFGHADLVLAVPDFWTDCRTLGDLDAVAGRFRAAHGRRLRIATKYHRLVREHLRAAGVADYVLIDSQGATEGTVANGAAEAVADITSSGATLRDNHLRVLDGPPIHRSEATLFRSRMPAWTPGERAALDGLTRTLGLATAPPRTGAWGREP